MVRVPNTTPTVRERYALIRKLERDLARFQAIPANRREDECADVGEQTCRALLAELGVSGHEKPAKKPVEIVDLDAWLDKDQSQST